MNLKEYLLQIKTKKNRLGFMPFYMAGYPNIKESIERMKILSQYGDVLEIGIPFSDPCSDGYIIQNASKIAIENNFNTSDTFYCIKEVRQYYQTPIIILCYLNTIIQYGIEEFIENAKNSGVNAILIPDLPPEESQLINKYAKKYHIELAYTISTNTSIERIKYIDTISNSFIYFISKPSITGIQYAQIENDTINKINTIRDKIHNPLYIGFGISNKQQIEQYSKTKADGFIMGSKLISFNNNEELRKFLSNNL